jgi:hypothetical protein
MNTSDFLAATLRNPVNEAIAGELFRLALPDAWIVSGCLVQTVGVKIEVRNQARVHLWYSEKHGLPYPALRSSTQGIDRFLTRNTQIGIRRGQGYDVYAPHGFDDVVRMIVRPNPGPKFSAESYDAKTARWKKLWPEITVLPAHIA